MPESRHKYLYERLGSHDFQLLVNAVMPHSFQGYRPLPLGQADGGRDGVQDADGDTLVFQVKWSGKGYEKDPVAWLDAVVRGEADNLKRLAAAGARRYMLVTNVPSTGRQGSGTFDRLNAKLVVLARAYGLEEITCIWREGLDGLLDSVPAEVKWEYAEMLAGWDLMRYLINEQFGGKGDRGLRELLCRVGVTQWADDEKVKFSQVDVDRERVADLFIDVTAERLRSVIQDPSDPSARARGPRYVADATDVRLGGTAQYLLKTPITATLVRGAPGQGKSTLSQFVSQAHRAAFVPTAQQTGRTPPTPKNPRFPLRLDLSEYARWCQGVDVFEESDRRKTEKRPKKRPAAQSTLECFLAELMTFASGGTKVTAESVQDIFDRVPSVVVLDGLDEVGSSQMRGKVVDAIDKFTRRAQTYPVPVQVVVTTRPSNNVLPEPEAELFEVIVLKELTVEQRDEYLRRWCTVRDIRGREGRAVRKSFNEKIAEPYIGELAGNPMQLTILLDLIHERGAATPSQRTNLYDAYVELLLAREANKHPESVRKHRDDLKEVIPFLGWYLQSRGEELDQPGRMSLDQLKAAMRHFQHCYGKPMNVVDELLDAASDRLWALTSKTEDTYEFEVLSLREYFAAHFLYHFAGEDEHGFNRTRVLRELLRRPNWLNTARFYGGNAQGGGVALLADGVIEELRSDDCPPQSRTAGWTLVTDGVFQSRPRDARAVIDALLGDDNGIKTLLDALNVNEVRPLPGLPVLHDHDGPDPTWTRLTSAIAANPSAPGTRLRIRALRELLNQKPQFASWWASRMAEAAGTPNEHHWLAVAAHEEAAAGVALDLDALDLTRDGTASLALNTGLVPTPGGQFEARLLQAVLDGRCSDIESTRSMPAQVAVALQPSAFIAGSDNGFADVDNRYVRRRSDAIAKLRRTAPEFGNIARRRKFTKGQKGSTFPWSDTATALYAHAGPCWLASEIAILGAASPMRLGVTRQPDAAAFGPNSHPAELLAQTRAHAKDAQWWRDQLATASPTNAGLADDLAAAEWTLALWSVASGAVFDELFSEWEATFQALEPTRRHIMYGTAWTITSLGLLKTRPVKTPFDADATDQVSWLLRLRVPKAPSMDRKPMPGLTPGPPPPPPLALVAREEMWFKVDAVAVYS